MRQMEGRLLNMKKKIVALLIAGSLCASSLAACGQTETPADTETDISTEAVDDTDAPSGETDSTAVASAEPSAEAETSHKAILDTNPLNMFKTKRTVGLVTSSGGMNDESFNQSAWEGLERVVGSYGCDEIYIETRPGTDFTVNLEGAIAKDPDLCWSVGYNSAEAMHAAALAHPDISFAIIDNALEDTPENMTYVVFRDQEPSFLVGYIAGCVTGTGKVGFVGGESNEVIEAFQSGYMGGVAYSQLKTGRNVDVYAEYTGTFSDKSKGREAASKLYDQGCDIIFHAAGETGLGVIEVARERGLYVIGADKDQSYLAPENMLTSALKYVSVAIFTISGDYLSGKDIGGQTINLGLAENSVGISGQHTLYSEDIYNEAMKLREQIIDGTLIPPSDLTEYKEFTDNLE